jgi:hypothetical protein
VIIFLLPVRAVKVLAGLTGKDRLMPLQTKQEVVEQLRSLADKLESATLSDDFRVDPWHVARPIVEAMMHDKQAKEAVAQ